MADEYERSANSSESADVSWYALSTSTKRRVRASSEGMEYTRPMSWVCVEDPAHGWQVSEW
jgi:hypothetical protein